MGYISVVIVFVSISIFQGLNIFSNFWLTYWTEDEVLKNTTLSGTPEYEEKYLYYLLMYLFYGVVQGNDMLVASSLRSYSDRPAHAHSITIFALYSYSTFCSI